MAPRSDRAGQGAHAASEAVHQGSHHAVVQHRRPDGRLLAASGSARAGEPINLTPTEYRILAYLARNAGRVVTQDDLLTKVWGPAYRDEAHLLRVNIARLRQKVEPEPSNPRYVITRPGIGYSLAKHDGLSN